MSDISGGDWAMISDPSLTMTTFASDPTADQVCEVQMEFTTDPPTDISYKVNSVTNFFTHEAAEFSEFSCSGGTITYSA
jgi:hypothetical protein